MFLSKNNRVQSRLLRVFVLQLVLISVVTIIGVIVESLILERILVNKALRGEAEFFWDHRAESPEFKLPETLNLTAFLSSDNQEPVPEAYRDLPLGQHRVENEQGYQIMHVSERDGQRLYLLFAGGAVRSLVFYFGALPLILVLLTTYGFALLSYLLVKQAISPVTRLAGVIESFDFNKREANELNLANFDHSSNSETGILVEALDHFVERSQTSINRERNFTRYASHELRTPLAVIQGSASSLELLELDGAPGRAVQRIRRTSQQMGELLNSLLVLARGDEDINIEKIEPLHVNHLLAAEIVQLEELYSERGNTVSINDRAPLDVKASETVFCMMLGNILGNAFSYTRNGHIQVTIERGRIIVADSGVGMNKETVDKVFEPFYRENPAAGSTGNQGLGLAIVDHICRKYGWDVNLSSIKDYGTRVTIDF